MADVKAEQLINQNQIPGGTFATFKILTEANEASRYVCPEHVFENKRFSKGREGVEDNFRTGQPRATITDRNIAKVCNVKGKK